MSARDKLSGIRNKYVIPITKCHDIRRAMIEDMTIGLETNGKKSSCKMLPSRVLTLPNGSEKGIYYGMYFEYIVYFIQLYLFIFIQL